jgi:uncharacterized membrane protein
LKKGDPSPHADDTVVRLHRSKGRDGLIVLGVAALVWSFPILGLFTMAGAASYAAYHYWRKARRIEELDRASSS